MKKWINLLLAGIVVVGLSGCGEVVEDDGWNDDTSGDYDGDGGYSSVSTYNLEYGYTITGYNEYDSYIELVYCSTSRYTYYRNNTVVDTGTFYISNGSIQMPTDNGGSHRIDADTLYTGSTYRIHEVESISINSISSSGC